MRKEETSQFIMDCVTESDLENDAMSAASREVYEYFKANEMTMEECSKFEELIGELTNAYMLYGFKTGFKTALNLAQEMRL